MRRTQIQLPEPLFRHVRRVARLLDWSVAEVLRRGAEHIVSCYPPGKSAARPWTPPPPRHLGEFLLPVEDWRDVSS